MKSLGTVSAVALLCLGLAIPVTNARAQQQSLKEQLVGTWSIMAEVERKDGSRFNPMGANSKGVLIFAADGHFALMNTRADRPKFASNNRMEGTPEENKAAVQGTIAYFGTYTVDEANKTFTMSIERGTYPNDEGTSSTRPITSLTADELKFINPASTIGGARVHVTAKRASPGGAATVGRGTEMPPRQQ